MGLIILFCCEAHRDKNEETRPKKKDESKEKEKKGCGPTARYAEAMKGNKKPIKKKVTKGYKIS